MNSDVILKLANNFYSLATIPVPIRNIKHFLKNFPNKILNTLNLINEHLSPPSNFDEDQINNYLRDIFANLNYNRIKYLIERINNFIKYAKSNLSDTFEGALTTSTRYFSEAIGHSVLFLQYFLDDLTEFKNIVNDDHLDLKGADENYEYIFKKHPEEDINEGEYFRSIKQVPKLLNNLCEEISSYLSSFKEYKRQMSSDKRPESENEETLYHASINADNIFSNGFHKESIKTEGIGGSTATHSGKHGISFTADLYVAKEVARCLKEAIMIANGEINGKNILEWSDNKDKLLDLIKNIHGSKLDYFNPEDTFNIYTSYLATENRYNPLFFGHASKFIKLFKGKDPSQVGIIVAKVDMNNPDITYFSAMSEYRAPAEAVISIEKLIK